MGSRLMHTIIAHEIASRVNVADTSSFILGGVAPDAVAPKDLSHFYKGDPNDYTRSIDYKAFLHKYSNYKDHPYILGYYTHLIADDIWLKGFYLPWLKNRLENDSTILERYHHDFKRLNSKLMFHYQTEPDLLKDILGAAEPIEIEEVSLTQVSSFIPYVEQDMMLPKSDEPLEVFTMEMIIGYIETSIDMGVQYISKHLIGKSC
ncbi:zinc dependent phospholipase C family protein [Sutcliffiella horikoshii]|uniref:Zinc dependent phospholipase C family protein n=1 Tax=Sutcliffiella horikoshii TaxID=79883 RepID=A0A5D4T469_9BACI|nr:zinc dependent phospholipase C family protein [Sutcliffiella horikoshii]TYS70413.1 zinc dependent phospholipase C family protein [Sutcliffiella horikoshii]